MKIHLLFAPAARSTILKLVIALLPISFAGLLPAQEFKQPLKIWHIAGDFYIYTTYNQINGTLFPSNSMYVVSTEGIIMIDTPWDSTQFQPFVDSIAKRHGKKVIICIATHFHDDRTGGFDFLKQNGVRTFSSKQTLELCRSRGEKTAEYSFTNDTIFSIGSHSFQAFYPGEGNTKDNIIMWFPDEKILYGGCFVKSSETDGIGNIADANLEAWPASVKAVTKKFPDVKYVVPGHFGGTTKKSLNRTIKLLRKQERM